MVPTEGKMDLQTCVCLENKTENRTCRHATKCWGLEGIAIVWKHEMKILWLVLLKLQICMITIYNTVWTNMIQYVHTSRHASITIIYIYIWHMITLHYIHLALSQEALPAWKTSHSGNATWMVRSKNAKTPETAWKAGPSVGCIWCLPGWPCRLLVVLFQLIVSDCIWSSV